MTADGQRSVDQLTLKEKNHASTVSITGLSFHRPVGRHTHRLLGSHRPDFPEYSFIKMPGMRKFSNITLKRGIVKSDNEFFRWLSTVSLNTVERRDIIISLLNEQHEPVMTWVAHNAFPVKVEGPQLKASGNEVAIESIELAHEGLTLENE